MTYPKKSVFSKKALLVFLLLLIGLLHSASAQTIYYSRQSGNWNALNTWSLTSHTNTNVPGSLPGVNDSILIGNGHVVTLPSGATGNAGSITVHDAGASGTLVIGSNNNTGATLNVSGNLTLNSSGTLRPGGDGDATHALNIGGDLVNNNVFNMINAVAGIDDFINVTFNGSEDRTISGSGGTFSFNNFTLNAGGNNLSVESSIRIQGTLSFSANGVLAVDANSNITIASTSAITGANANRYVQLDGTSGSNSQLIRENAGTEAAWEFLFPVGTATGGYTPLDMTAASGANVATAPDANSTLAVKAIYNGSSIGKMRRTFRLVVSGNNNATTLTNADFYYNAAADVSAGDVVGNYTTLWFLDTSGSGWSAVTGTAPGAGFFTASSIAKSLDNGTYFYTIGNSTAYPSTWYSYQNGVWSNPNVWTLDPSGTSLTNPLLQYPSSGDEVVILNGFTVTSDLDDLTLSSTTIQDGAILDMAATTGHTLGAISGTGLMRINGIERPSGTYTSFVASTGGTIEYYNAGGTIVNAAAPIEYNNLIFSNNTGSAVTFITAADLTVRGNLNVTQTGGGTVTWQINDGTGAQREISIAGDLTVSSGGQIRVGTGNEGTGFTNPHIITLNGDLTNNGSIKFFDATDNELQDADYTSGAVYTNELQGNAANVTFSGGVNQTVTCNSTTDFYRFIVDKGTGQQAKITVNSADAANFRLFGPANRFSTGDVSNCALSISNGTLELTGTLTIPVLIVPGTGGPSVDVFAIPQTGALWINGPDVSVTLTDNSTVNKDDQRLTVNGMFRVTSGTFNSGYSRGVGSSDGGTVLIEGGTVNMWQYRPVFGGSGIFSYIQTGGTVNVGTTGHNGTPALSGVDDGVGGVTDQYARFSFDEPASSFQMTGGTLNVGTPTTPSGGQGALAGGIDIQCASGNINVTGGIINVYIPAAGNNFSIYSTAPLPNLNIYKAGGGALSATLNSSLTVLNDITLIDGANDPTLNCNNNNLTIGGNFTIQNGTTLNPGGTTNTITFNGSGTQNWSNDGTITGLNNVVVNKSAGVLTLSGNDFPNITGTASGLTLMSGTLHDGGKTITVTNTLINSATHTSSANGSIVCNGPVSIGGSEGTFGNLTILTNGQVSTSGNQTVSNDLRLVSANTTVNIGSNNLQVLGNIYTNAAPGTATAFGNTKRILTNGLRNDAGLTRKPVSGNDLVFPVGTPTFAYTPATINVTASVVGTVTIRPVQIAHPNITAASQSLRFFWGVTSDGFDGISAVIHKAYTFSTATKDGTQTTYTPARYNPADFTWAYQTTSYNATGTSVIPDFSTGGGAWTGLSIDELDGEYTAGNSGAFGVVKVYYSRNSGPWGVASTWSNTAVGGGDITDSAPPCASCPVVIGDSTTTHTITIDAHNASCGSLFIATGSTLDCGAFNNLNFGVNTGVEISGRGKLRIASAAFPAGDFTTFIGPNGGTVEWYGATKTIPSTGPAPQNLVLDNYYNLTISPNNASVITLPASNLTIFNDLVISASGLGLVYTNEAAARTITVNRTFDIQSGTFSLRNNNVTNLVLDSAMAVSGTMSVEGGGGTVTHTLTTQSSIINAGTIDFQTGNEVVNITFTGDSNESFTTTGNTTLNFVTVNKGTSQAPVIIVDGTGTITAPGNNWLTLQNGTINFNKTGGTFTLTNTATTFSIPSTAKLAVQNGTVNIGSIASNAADLLLSGTLELTGGAVNIGVTTNDTNNDIEYSSAGTPTINVSGGALYVNGGIRRSTSTLSGALVYNQTGGSLVVGGRNCDANNERGVFEIESNSGSSFTLTGTSSLTVSRSSGGTAFADLYLNPESSDISSTSTIQIGSNALGNQTLSVNIVPSVGNFRVLGAAGNAQTVNMRSSELTTAGTLTVNQSGTLNTNSLDVIIGADLAIVGTYNGSNNTTTFNGSGAQAATLSATSTFLHMTVDKPTGTATLSGTSPTITNLNILNGILDVSTIGLTVTGDVVNNSIQTGSGSITMSGTATKHTITSTGGAFTNLTLGGSATTKTVTVEGDLTINGTLNFAATNRFLYIGGYRLNFGTNASASGVGSTAFVRTNGASSDKGVVKNWGATGANATFNYPVGAMNSYTPVQFTLSVTSAGSITVIPVNKRHPSYNFTSVEQILNYYWIVTRDASIIYDTDAPAHVGPHTYSYPAALMGGSGGALLAGYIDLSNPLGWVSSGHGGSANATTMTYTGQLNTNIPDVAGTYHYTVGTSATLTTAITRVYSRFTGGDWTDNNSWTTTSTGTGAALDAFLFPNGPVGLPVVILSGATIVADLDSRSALSTQIDGTLVIGTSVGHDLGIITGTGTLRSSTNTFPAGTYSAFVAATGGTIEYNAPLVADEISMSGQVQLATYNNLSITGSGTVRTTSSDITINGNLTIGTGATLNNSTNNSNITLAGNWANNGIFTAGTGTVIFNGSVSQNITGATNFYNMTISKPGGNVTLASAATVNGTLTLTTGHVISTAANILGFNSSATVSGGSASSFISGVASKVMAAGSTFTFPLGSATGSRYRPLRLANTGLLDTWTVEYIGNDPTSGGFENTSVNSLNIQKASDFEYWNISHALVSNEADVTLSYNTGSYGGSDVGNVSSLRVGHWDALNSRWDLASFGTHTQSGTNIAGTVTAPDVNNFSPFTLSSLDLPSPLPLEWLIFTADRLDNLSVNLNWKTAQEHNSERFEIERSSDGLNFFKIGSVPGAGNSAEIRSYEYSDTEASASLRHYYRIRQIDYDGKFDYSDVVVVMETGEVGKRWMVSPNPVAENQSLLLSNLDMTAGDEPVSIVVVSSGGQIIFRETGSLNDISSNLERISSVIRAGVYLLKVGNGDYHETFRIVRY